MEYQFFNTVKCRYRSILNVVLKIYRCFDHFDNTTTFLSKDAQLIKNK